MPTVPKVTLPIKYSVYLAEQLSDRFKRSVYWNSYQTISANIIDKWENIYELVSTSFLFVKRFFVLAYDIAANSANNEAGIKAIGSIFFQDEELKITTYWLMEVIFMTNRLMI